MRQAFVAALTELAARDERILLLTADLGFSFLEPFRDRFPDRFFNVGVAEANLIGLATGLAEDGYVPFTYTMAAFALPRAFEMVRNGPVAHRLPVRIVGVGGGFDYGTNGPTHHALDDLALARALRGLEVFVPIDDPQARAAMLATAGRQGPIYLRLGTEERGTLTACDDPFAPGHLTVLKPRTDPRDVGILALGASAFDAIEAANVLESAGVTVSVAGVSCLRPMPVEGVRETASTSRLIVTVEAHGRDGGLGSLVAEILTEARLQTPLVRIGVTGGDVVPGSPPFLRSELGLDGASLARRIGDALRGA